MEQVETHSLWNRIFRSKQNNIERARKNRVLFKPAGANSGIRDGKNHIKYDKDLVGFLKEDHRVLIAKFLEIEANVRAREYLLAVVNCDEFLHLLRGHVYEENIKLYTFLAASDTDDSAESKQMQIEMRKIHSLVKKFIESYLTVGLSDKNSSDFLDSWVGKDGNSTTAIVSQRKSMKAVLLQRINTEERHLYPCYETLGGS